MDAKAGGGIEDAISDLVTQGYPLQLVRYALRRSGGDIITATNFVRSKVPNPTPVLESSDEEDERKEGGKATFGWWWGGEGGGINDSNDTHDTGVGIRNEGKDDFDFMGYIASWLPSGEDAAIGNNNVNIYSSDEDSDGDNTPTTSKRHENDIHTSMPKSILKNSGNSKEDKTALQARASQQAENGDQLRFDLGEKDIKRQSNHHHHHRRSHRSHRHHRGIDGNVDDRNTFSSSRASPDIIDRLESNNDEDYGELRFEFEDIINSLETLPRSSATAANTSSSRRSKSQRTRHSHNEGHRGSHRDNRHRDRNNAERRKSSTRGSFLGRRPPCATAMFRAHIPPPPHLYATFGFDKRKKGISNDLIARRHCLIFQIKETEKTLRRVGANTRGTSVFRARICMQQPHIKAAKSPQGSRRSLIDLGYFPSYASAHLACRAISPPIWDPSYPKNVRKRKCHICKKHHTFMKPVHHCRNCGYNVCIDCSGKIWPSSMVPITYHNNERIIRVCDTCAILAEVFCVALREGDLQKAVGAYCTGNVNVHCPISIYTSMEFPIHSACIGGNLDLVRWLVEGKQCSLVDTFTGAPLRTAQGLTALDLAAHSGASKVVQYLGGLNKFSRFDFEGATRHCLYMVERRYTVDNSRAASQRISRQDSIEFRENNQDLTHDMLFPMVYNSMVRKNTIQRQKSPSTITLVHNAIRQQISLNDIQNKAKFTSYASPGVGKGRRALTFRKETGINRKGSNSGGSQQRNGTSVSSSTASSSNVSSNQSIPSRSRNFSGNMQSSSINRPMISPKEPSKRVLQTRSNITEESDSEDHSEEEDVDDSDVLDASNGEWMRWLAGWCPVDTATNCTSTCDYNCCDTYDFSSDDGSVDDNAVDNNAVDDDVSAGSYQEDCCLGLVINSHSHVDNDSIFDSEGDSDYDDVSDNKEEEYAYRESIEGDVTLNLSRSSRRRKISKQQRNDSTSSGPGVISTATATTTTFENGATSSIKHNNSRIPRAIPLSTLIADMGLRSVGELHHAPDVQLLLEDEPPIAAAIKEENYGSGEKRRMNSKQLLKAENIGLVGQVATKRLKSQGHLCASDLGMGAMYLIVSNQHRRRRLFRDTGSDEINVGDENLMRPPQDSDSIVPTFYDQQGNEIDEDYGRTIQARPILQSLTTRISNVTRNIFSGYSGYIPGGASGASNSSIKRQRQ